MIELESPCKVNLVLNILGKRPDGFHELETLMLPIPLCDRIRLQPALSGGTSGGSAIQLTCSDPSLAVDGTNLVHKAATAFLKATAITDSVAIHLEKRIPMAAGLGGGSGNAATTLTGLNRLFGNPLTVEQLQPLAAALGSDVPFFLQDNPALAVGRGEQVSSVPKFSALAGTAILLIHPGFGISTPWAYQQLARFPEALNGRPGRAGEMVEMLNQGKLIRLATHLYNSLEAPALEKYPVLALYQEHLRSHGALGALMSGSGSTTFAIYETPAIAEKERTRFLAKFGTLWTAVVPL